MSASRRRVSQPPINLQMSDIARLAGVSESTVSRALKDSPMIAASTRERIRRLAEEAGYTVNPVASSLRSRQTGVITVGVPLVHEREPHLVDPFMMTMLAHLADTLADRGYNMLLSKIAVHQDDWLRRLQQPGRSDGVILIGQSLEHAAINDAARAGIPLVAWGAKLPAQKYPVVGTDNRLGGRLATERLLSQGCRRIVFLGDERLPEIAHRHDGYRQALRAAGIKPSPELLVRSGFAGPVAEAHATCSRPASPSTPSSPPPTSSPSARCGRCPPPAARCRRTWRWSASTTSCWPNTRIRRSPPCARNWPRAQSRWSTR